MNKLFKIHILTIYLINECLLVASMRNETQKDYEIKSV